MKLLLLFIAILLASCADRVPRAIIPPPSVIAELDVAPVAEASRATREAVRKVSVSVDDASRKAERVADDAQRLKEMISKARAGVEADMELSLAAADAIMDSLLLKIGELQELLRITRIARDIAIATVDDQQDVIAGHAAHAKAQAAQIRYAKAAENTLRTQVEALAESADKRVIAEEKLRWWRTAAGLTWAFLAVFLIIKIFGSALAANLHLR